MGLTDKKSTFDRNRQGDIKEGPTVGKSLPSNGDYFNPHGNTNSPFDNGDHLKALLENTIVNSKNSAMTYDPSLMIGNTPEPLDAIDSFPDFDGGTPPPFQRPKATADQIHQSSLSVVPQPPSNSPFQDRLDANATSSPAGYKNSGGPIDGFY